MVMTEHFFFVEHTPDNNNLTKNQNNFTEKLNATSKEIENKIL